MSAPEAVKDRDALYYPFIHLRDETWLRGTLLFFPHVLRMVPSRYDLKDTEFVRQLTETEGRWGKPLVGSYPLDSSFAYSAGSRLAARFAADPKASQFRESYSRSATVNSFGSDAVFQIHKDKFASALEETLRDLELVWRPSIPRRGDWLAVHPVIGEIVMSIAAVAAARHKGCDILTDTKRNHLAAASDDEEAIYDKLLGRMSNESKVRETEAREVGDLVIATTFDLSGLKPADFGALSREREALFDFKVLLAQRAGRIPPMADDTTRLAIAREAAEDILTEWESKRRTWGKFMRRALRLEAADEAKDVATNLLTAVGVPMAAAGTSLASTGSVLLGAVPGLAVGFSLYGAKVWRDLGVEERTAPTRFLSLVESHGGVLSAATE